MTTECTRPVRRKTSHLQRDKGKLRAMIVSIHPGGYIGLRLEGTRRTETLTIGAAYDVAVKCRVARERSEKLKAKKAKQKGR